MSSGLVFSAESGSKKFGFFPYGREVVNFPLRSIKMPFLAPPTTLVQILSLARMIGTELVVEEWVELESTDFEELEDIKAASDSDLVTIKRHCCKISFFRYLGCGFRGKPITDYD